MGVRVREKPKGSGVWYVFINHQGMRKSKKIGSDEKLARKVAEKIKAKLVLNELNVEKINEKSYIFEEVAKLWIKQPHDWRASTWESYQLNLKLYVLPFFGQHRIDEIKRKDVKNFFDDLLSKGVAPNTVRLIRSPLNGVLNYAVDSEMIEVNPTIGLKISKKRSKTDIIPLNEQEASLLLEEAKTYKEGLFYPPLLCALRTGLRIGEIKALKWSDLDFDNRFIEVKRSCRKGIINMPKNGKHRRVDMTPHLAETLKVLKIDQKKLALKKGRPFSDLVFANRQGGMFGYKVLRKCLSECLSQAGLREIRIHDLRHTYTTIRLLRGHNIGDISYQLGHSSIDITYDQYGHWVPGSFKSEVDDLDNPHLNAPYVQPDLNELKN